MLVLEWESELDFLSRRSFTEVKVEESKVAGRKLGEVFQLLSRALTVLVVCQSSLNPCAPSQCTEVMAG